MKDFYGYNLVVLLFWLVAISLVRGQFRVVDASPYQPKSEKSTREIPRSIVQINNYAEPKSGQARFFSNEPEDNNVIKAQTKTNPQKREIRANSRSKTEDTNNHQDFEDDDDKSSHPQDHQYFDKSQADAIHLENQRIIDKSRANAAAYNKYKSGGTFRTKCRCVLIGGECPRLQITVGRCNSNEILCCF